MKYIPSINIESNIINDFNYIVTPNAQSALANIISSFHSGIHSFTLIGTYGTGKSSFLMALYRDLSTNTNVICPNSKVFSDYDKFEFLNITGEYSSLKNIFSERLGCSNYNNSKNIIEELDLFYNKIQKEGKFLFIIIDEFGKILEHAANNNPEQELYFLQTLAEYVNDHSKNIILLTTLHQNFGTYANKLSENQKNEWIKVKGRYKEIVFIEPVEQLLYLAAENLQNSSSTNKNIDGFIELYSKAKKSKFASENLSLSTIKSLYPLDPFSAICLTKAIQRYGQNERTLFSFLTSKDENSITSFSPSIDTTYNLGHVFDYITYNFYSVLNEVNADTMQWSVIRVALERTTSGIIESSLIHDATCIIKAIALLNLFGNSGVKIDKELLIIYAKNALGIKNPAKIIEKLEQFKVIRYATYKNQYILFEGTDIDIEDELYKANTIVIKPKANIDDLRHYIDQKVSLALAAYFNTGTPRYFEFIPTNELQHITPVGEIDGYINMIFPNEDTTLQDIIDYSRDITSANIFVYFNNMSDIIEHLYEIKKLQYLIDTVILDDRIAKREIINQQVYEKTLLNKAINNNLINSSGNVTWIYKGEIISICNQKDFNKLISFVSQDVYYSTPVMRNELFNKHKISSAISSARVNLLDAILSDSDKIDLGFDTGKFPPEKTIYYSLLKNTGIHRQDIDGSWYFGEPTCTGLSDLWTACCEFVESSRDKQQKLGDLIKILKTEPFKLKQGFLDFWIPIFLFIKQQDFALYNSDGVYIMNITKEVFELIQKKPTDFYIKAFSVDGVKMEFFKKYRHFLKQDDNTDLKSSSFIDTFKPFIHFYKSLNEYAKNTYKFENTATSKFRDVLAKAKDPEKVFFEDLPAALGYKKEGVSTDEEFLQQYLFLIRNAVRELNICYDNFIDRIEGKVIDAIGLPNDYPEYLEVLSQRYQNVKRHLLTKKTRVFLERILSPSTSKKDFFEKISNVVFDKKLESTKDKEEELLIDNMLFMFREIERYIPISKELDTNIDDEVYNFELASNVGKLQLSQTYRLSQNQKNKASDIKEKIETLLSGDDNLDVCILLKILNEKIDK